MSDEIMDKSDWLNLEINGQAVRMPPGSTVMEAAASLKIYIPHFCYHKKLSLAANCRMCLVEVEKIPKPVPACATVISEGMKVKTRGKTALAAQQAVMEFLLINHPLDCPICDQGGECQLQDLAFGYGKGTSQFSEEKRVVVGKDLGALVSAAEMSRCIQCTRCTRFAEEIGGAMELGMVNRGDRAEVVPFIGETYDSEISGNVIDLCPVGALTSKPFRYHARSWELIKRQSVSPHDALGSNLVMHVKRDKVVRVMPQYNETINECWLADRDRFSYEALNSETRLTKPLIKKDGKLIEAEWQEALPLAAARLKNIIEREGADALGALISPHATIEEIGLFTRLVRSLGCENIDSRLRQRDFSADDQLQEATWLGMPIVAVNDLRAMLFIGSFLRFDHPLLAVRVRQAAKRGAKISSLHAQRADWRLPITQEIITSPSQMAASLAQIVSAAQRATNKNKILPKVLRGIEPSPEATTIANDLLAHHEHAAIFVGTFAQQHENAFLLRGLAQLLAELTGATLGILPDAANSVGAQLLNARPKNGGLNARTMFEKARKAYIMFNVEFEDLAQGAQVAQAATQADCVVAFSAFYPQGNNAILPDIVLPITPFSETSGTLMNMEGRAQSFRAVIPPLGAARPGWQILVTLSRLFGQVIDEDTPEAVRVAFLPDDAAIHAHLSNTMEKIDIVLPPPIVLDQNTFERCAAIPAYSMDALVRRAASLQKTPLAAAPTLRIRTDDAEKMKLSVNHHVRIRSQGAASEKMALCIDDTLAKGTVRVDAAHDSTNMLVGVSGVITLEICHD
ncbi:MAG: NADH-quinone oxidoreductase subunit NuoG [Burkholderiales bacterium]|jgi:NADH-quinone oxidoreductase subunit G|nr:NADH-quinone oxidoreductase subunit NuoG [Burkholderiales bacterium]